MQSCRRYLAVAGKALRIGLIALLAFFSLSALVLWQQSRLPDYHGWYGAVDTSEHGLRLPLGGNCAVKSTTVYGKTAAPLIRGQNIADHAYSLQCTWLISEDLRTRVVVNNGSFEVAYCWFVPPESTVIETTRDFQIVEFSSGRAPEMTDPAEISLEVIDGWVPPPVLVAHSARIHLLVAAFICGVYPALAFICGPFLRWCRHRRGSCTACGYNLAGLTEPRCPECGTSFDR